MNEPTPQQCGNELEQIYVVCPDPERNEQDSILISYEPNEVSQDYGLDADPVVKYEFVLESASPTDINNKDNDVNADTDNNTSEASDSSAMESNSSRGAVQANVPKMKISPRKSANSFYSYDERTNTTKCLIRGCSQSIQGKNYRYHLLDYHSKELKIVRAGNAVTPKEYNKTCVGPKKVLRKKRILDKSVLNKQNSKKVSGPQTLTAGGVSSSVLENSLAQNTSNKGTEHLFGIMVSTELAKLKKINRYDCMRDILECLKKYKTNRNK